MNGFNTMRFSLMLCLFGFLDFYLYFFSLYLKKIFILLLLGPIFCSFDLINFVIFIYLSIHNDFLQPHKIVCVYCAKK